VGARENRRSSRGPAGLDRTVRKYNGTVCCFERNSMLFWVGKRERQSWVTKRQKQTQPLFPAAKRGTQRQYDISLFESTHGVSTRRPVMPRILGTVNAYTETETRQRQKEERQRADSRWRGGKRD
jgi:hypothetical protein